MIPRRLRLFLLLAAFPVAAVAQIVLPGGGSGGSGGSITFTTSCPSGSTTGSTINLANGANVAAKSANYTTVAGDCGTIFEVTGAHTITGLATITSGFQFSVLNANAPGGSTVTVAAGGSNTIGNNGASSITITPGQVASVVAGSGASPTNWDLGVAFANADGPPFQASLWYAPNNWSTITASPVTNTTTTYCTPGWIRSINGLGSGSATLAALGYRIQTAGTTNVQLALYANDTTVSPNRPGTLLANTGNIQNSSVGGANTGSVTPISIGGTTLYWFCLQSDDATFKFEAVNGNTSSLVLGPAVGTTGTNGPAVGVNAGGVTTTGTFGTWPASLHGSTWTEAQLTPILEFQFSSIP